MSNPILQSLDPDAPAPEPRRGFALVGALLALVVVGALVTGSFFAASQEQSIGLAAKYNDDALYVAETALDSIIGSVPISTIAAYPGPQEINSNLQVSSGGQTIGSAEVWVRKMGNYYFFVSKGTASRGGSTGGGTRVLGVFARQIAMNFKTDRAMQVYSGVKVGGNSTVSGLDIVPSGMGNQWDTCSLVPEGAAIVTNTGAPTSIGGSSTVTGNPPVVQTTLGSNDFFSYGDLAYDQLASMADAAHTFYTNVSGANIGNPVPSYNALNQCNISDPLNWGEPWKQFPNCIDYFPIIHAVGSLTLQSNGRGQGILLVDGDLTMTGGFEFWGITIVKGGVFTSGNGGHLNGVVMAWNQGDLDSSQNTTLGNSVVQLSSCAVRRALTNSPASRYAVPVPGHSWVDLTAAGVSF